MWLQMCDYTHVERDKVDGRIDDEEADGRASSLDSHPAQLHPPFLLQAPSQCLSGISRHLFVSMLLATRLE